MPGAGTYNLNLGDYTLLDKQQYKDNNERYGVR